MKNLFAGAVALSLLVAGAASAQTDQPRPDQSGGYHQDQHHQQDQGPGYDRSQQYQNNRDQRGGYQTGDRGDHMDRGYGRDHHDGGRRACHWRYHHRVCRWYH
jgi:opacity protein-like surface antigen